MRHWVPVAMLAIALAGCSVGDIAGNLAGTAGGGRVGELTRAAVGGVADAQTQVLTKFSPEQEYVLGRAAAAQILAQYRLDPNEVNQEYVRLIGASIVGLSTRLTQTYGGYHFGVLDSDEPNGLSAPGGYVFITRGALRECKSEDEVAAILAHELAHVSLKHGESVVIRGRNSGVMAGAVARFGAAVAGAGDSGVNRGLGNVIGEAAETYVAELVRTGYGREAELAADQEGALILYDVGYDANALSDYLKTNVEGGGGTWSHHPASATRVRALAPVLKDYGGTFGRDAEKAARTARFQQVMQGMPAVAPEAPEVTGFAAPQDAAPTVTSHAPVTGETYLSFDGVTPVDPSTLASPTGR